MSEMNNPNNSDNTGMKNLMDVMRHLIGPQGCPWDRVQTHESIRKNMIEEAYEAVDAIDSKDPDKIKDELGDVLLQVVFHAAIAEKNGMFNLDDIANQISRKLVRRHSHIFGNDQASSPDEVLSVWEKNKMSEKGQNTFSDTLYDLPHGLPALVRSEKLQKRAAKAGFDWPDAQGGHDKIFEEVEEIRHAYNEAGATSFSKIDSLTDPQLFSEVEDEVGDLFFAAVNFSRLLGIDPEVALNRANNKFVHRFSSMERVVLNDKKNIEEMSLEEMDTYWEKAKRLEHENG